MTLMRQLPRRQLIMKLHRQIWQLRWAIIVFHQHGQADIDLRATDHQATHVQKAINEAATPVEPCQAETFCAAAGDGQGDIPRP